MNELKFILFFEKKENTKSKKKKINAPKKKLIIWTFGGSTTEGNTPNCGHETSNWPNELAKLNENISALNFAKSGMSTSYSLNALLRALSEVSLTNEYSKDLKNRKPDIILWANKVNEWNNFDHNKKPSINIQTLNLTLKQNSLFYFIFDYIIEAINYRLFRTKYDMHLDKEGINLSSNIKLELSSQIYEQKTVEAINISKKFDIDFHILSLFGKYGKSFFNEEDISNHFYHPKFYYHWFNVAKKISKEHNVFFFKTEGDALEIVKNKKEEKFFCRTDVIHQTLKGNILTASIINDYLIKIYNYENK